MARRRSAYRGYVYPFSGSATVGRIDQGQDFGGRGSILAIGNAEVVKLGAPGWPGGGGILYRLLDGPRRGRYVFVYEGVRPAVHVGQRVAAGEVIGQIIPGTSTGIETGWAKANGEPVSHAEYHEGLETRAGKAFAGFLASLKGSGGPARGSAQAGWLGDALSNAGKALGPAGVPLQLSGEAPQAVGEAESASAGLAGQIVSGLLGEIHAEALMLNIALLGGGAFLVYYGAALMLGVKAPAKNMAMLAWKGPAGAAGFEPPVGTAKTPKGATP